MGIISFAMKYFCREGAAQAISLKDNKTGGKNKYKIVNHVLLVNHVFLSIYEKHENAKIHETIIWKLFKIFKVEYSENI